MDSNPDHSPNVKNTANKVSVSIIGVHTVYVPEIIKNKNVKITAILPALKNIFEILDNNGYINANITACTKRVKMNQWLPNTIINIERNRG